ncbi:hypothetical protein DL96DRAFT_1585806 [Flagelloscypha sp. PMI_526]|nr:hypothetical protein DL96DRAFT_1585806 [Flagelloscypha sp. PMI_526]
MAFGKIPSELYRPIFWHLSQDLKSLAAICLSSSALRADAEARLYEQLVDLDLRTQLLLHRTVTTLPRLAQLVRRYAHREEWSEFFQVPIDSGLVDKDIDKRFWEIHIPEMLRAFTNLKTLILRRTGGAECAEVLTGCQFQLNTFSWGSCNTEIYLMPFLETQPQLVGLHVFWREDMPMPSSNDLRELISFVASSFYTVVVFLPGRNIQHLSWESDIEDPDQNELVREIPKYPGLGDAFRNLISLCVGGYFSGPSFEALIPFLPKLEVLEIRGTAIQSPRSLKDLPALRGVLFFGPSFFPDDRGDRKKLVDELFGQNTKLEFIFTAIQDGDTMLWYATTEQWERGTGSNPTRIIDPDDARIILQDMSGIP